MTTLKDQPCSPIQCREGRGDYQQAVHVLRAAASDAGQSEARRQWIRAATRC